MGLNERDDPSFKGWDIQSEPYPWEVLVLVWLRIFLWGASVGLTALLVVALLVCAWWVLTGMVG